MDSMNNRSEQAAELRKLAEEIAQKGVARLPETISPEDAQRIFHELSIHQIELEMQNEELRRTHAKLDAARARYFDFYNLAPVGYCTISEQGLILEANLYAATLLGVVPGALSRHPVSRFIHKEDQDIYYLFRKKLVKNGEPQACELRMLKENGTSFLAHLTATGAQDVNGNLVCRIVFSDIFDRKRAEHALLESRTQYLNLVEGTPDLITRVDADGRFLFVNHTALEFCGLAPEECIGRLAFDIIHPEDRAATADAFKNWLKSDIEVFTHENRLAGIDGRVYHMAWSIRAEYDESGHVCGFASTARDISKRKQAELEIKLKNDELLKLITEKDKFFSIIAHDLRSPLSAFLGLTQSMAKALPGLQMAEIQKIAVNMRNSSANLFRLLENLLDWARMQQGLIPFKPEEARLLPILKESLTMVLEPAQNKQIDMAYEIPDGMEVFADSNMLKTVIRNLVSNAVKFTPKGGKISISAKVADDKTIEISVKDSGIGMNSAITDNLFRLDVRTNRMGTEGELSTGIGLLLCKEFVEKHGGGIWVKSKEDKGSVFYFTIPGHALKCPE